MLLKWTKQNVNKNERVSSPHLMANAEDLARVLNIKQFLCTTSWTVRGDMHHISSEKASGEAMAPSCEMTTQCHNRVWPKVLEDFSDRHF